RIRPWCTRTEPMGIPPSLTLCSASSMAACMNGSMGFSWLSALSDPMPVSKILAEESTDQNIKHQDQRRDHPFDANLAQWEATDPRRDQQQHATEGREQRQRKGD